MVHVTPVPDRLEDSVGKTEEQDILGCFFAQVVVNAVHLAFIKYAVNCTVEFLRRGQIVPEGFFNHNPPPSRFLAGQPGFAQCECDPSKVFRCGCQVVQAVGWAALQCVQIIAQVDKIVICIQVTLEIVQQHRKRIPCFLIIGICTELLDTAAQVLA